MSQKIALLLCLAPLAFAADSSFLKDAHEGGVMEVKMGELAQTHASSQAVKDFAQRMITDHGKMNMDVKNVAMGENVSVSDDMSMMQKGSYDLLERKNGADFDKAYVERMIKDHEADLKAFQKEVNSGSDAQAKAVAEKAIPIIQEHLRMAQELGRQIGVQ